MTRGACPCQVAEIAARAGGTGAPADPASARQAVSDLLSALSARVTRGYAARLAVDLGAARIAGGLRLRGARRQEHPRRSNCISTSSSTPRSRSAPSELCVASFVRGGGDRGGVEITPITSGVSSRSANWSPPRQRRAARVRVRSRDGDALATLEDVDEGASADGWRPSGNRWRTRSSSRFYVPGGGGGGGGAAQGREGVAARSRRSIGTRDRRDRRRDRRWTPPRDRRWTSPSGRNHKTPEQAYAALAAAAMAMRWGNARRAHRRRRRPRRRRSGWRAEPTRGETRRRTRSALAESRHVAARVGLENKVGRTSTENRLHAVDVVADVATAFGIRENRSSGVRT